MAAVKRFTKQEIALEQLETALRLYEAGGEFFSVITLSGAAEEIYRRLLQERGGTGALEALAKGAAALHRHETGVSLPLDGFYEFGNWVKNASKHHSRGEATIICDAEEWAADYLQRAITNYFALTGDASPTMLKFEQGRRNRP